LIVANPLHPECVMRVAYLSFMSHPGEPAVSGVPKVTETLVREYERIPDIAVDVLTLTDGLAAEQCVERGSVRYHYIPCRPHGKTFTFYAREVALLKRRVRALKPEIVHGQPSSEYLLAATGVPFPSVITIHGLVLREAAGLSILHPGQLAMAIREFCQQRAVRRARHIISISPYVDDYVRGRTTGRLWPVPNPIDPEFFEIPAVDRLGLRLLCVGMVTERKNQELLVRAAAQLQKAGVAFECRIVGIPTPGYDVKLNQLIQELGVGGSVRLLGRVSREQLRSEYAWSNVVVLPSREETSPLSLIQAMAAGRVAMGAAAAGIPRLLQDGRMGTQFSPDAPEELVQAIRKLARDPGEFWERAERARVHAAATFQPAAVARRTIDVYRQAMGSGGR
jgi:glycosyltransferase involved in cell wall biosynthesis